MTDSYDPGKLEGPTQGGTVLTERTSGGPTPPPADPVSLTDPAETKAQPDGGDSVRPARPPAVTIVAAIFLLAALAWAVMAIWSLVSAQILFPPGGGLVDGERLRQALGPHPVIVAVREAAIGVVTLLAGIALLQMRPRAWLLAMVAALIVLAVELTSWWQATPNYHVMALAVAVVLLLNQTEVRDAFRLQAEP